MNRARLRGVSLLVVVATLLAAHALVPEAPQRERLLVRAVLGLGYGHLLGALVFGWRRLAARLPGDAGWPRGVLLASGAASLLVLYAGALARFPSLALGLLAVSAWHVIENDLAWSRVPDAEPRTPALPRDAAHHVLAAGATALALGAFLASAAPPTAVWPLPPLSPHLALHALQGVALAAAARLGWRRAALGLVLGAAVLSTPLPRGLGPGALFAALTLYHLVSWIGFFAARAVRLRRGGGAAARALRRRLLAVHAPGLALALAVPLLPEAPGRSLEAWVFSPALYLFWSVLHVAQTLVTRLAEPRRAALRSAA